MAQPAFRTTASSRTRPTRSGMPTSRSGDRLYTGTSGLGESSRTANARIKHAVSASALGKASVAAGGAIHKRAALADKTNLQQHGPQAGRHQDGKPQLSHVRTISTSTTDSNNTLKHKIPIATTQPSQQASAQQQRREPRSRQPSAVRTNLDGHALRPSGIPSNSRFTSSSSLSSTATISQSSSLAERKQSSVAAAVPTSSAPAIMQIDGAVDMEAFHDDGDDGQGLSSAHISSTAPTTVAAMQQHLSNEFEAEDDEDMSDAESDWHGSSGSDSQSHKMSSKTETEEEEEENDVDVKDDLAPQHDAFDTEIVAIDDYNENDRYNEEGEEEEEEDEDEDEEGDEDDDTVPVDANGRPLINEFDPECLLSLPFELESLARQKVAAICDRYEDNVVRPQTERAAEERREALLKGLVTPEVAAHDEELAQMGLDPEEVRDTSMAAEYAAEIFEYMSQCEAKTMANPSYMDFQGEIQWHMRATLVDWLMQLHMRYHMLPETLWIAVNIVDRFLSARVVSLAKLQLVGVTAMFVAAKYEEIMAPSVDEFVFMTEGGYSRDEILKGERIVLSTLKFNVSEYCSPYSWVRRISKADDYDIRTRTLSKFLMEVALFDHRFLRAKPSLIAAVGMFLAKKMLGGEWDDGFVYYSTYIEEQLVPGANLLLEKLIDPEFTTKFVYMKYAHKKFLKASTFAADWARRNHEALLQQAAAYGHPSSQQSEP